MPSPVYCSYRLIGGSAVKRYTRLPAPKSRKHHPTRLTLVVMPEGIYTIEEVQARLDALDIESAKALLAHCIAHGHAEIFDYAASQAALGPLRYTHSSSLYLEDAQTSDPRLRLGTAFEEYVHLVASTKISRALHPNDVTQRSSKER